MRETSPLEGRLRELITQAELDQISPRDFVDAAEPLLAHQAHASSAERDKSQNCLYVVEELAAVLDDEQRGMTALEASLWYRQLMQLRLLVAQGDIPGAVERGMERSECTEQEKSHFRERTLPKPVRAPLDVHEGLAAGLGVPPGVGDVWLVAVGVQSAVFFDPYLGTFGLSWGPSLTGVFVDLGWRSPDPVELLDL